MHLRRVRRSRWEVLATCSKRGDCPVLDFLAGLEGKLAKQAVRMLALLSQVAEDGPPRNVERSHQVAAEIWELIHGDLRILWFYAEGRIVVLTGGFVKKSQKTPRAEVEAAERALAEFREASRGNTLEIEEEA